MANPIPENFNSVSTYLIVKDADQAIELYTKAFGAKGGEACLRAPDGSVMHAELYIGNSAIMLSSENEQWGMLSAETMGGSPASLHLYVEDVDASFRQAIDAGCKEVAPVMDAFWGDRYGKVQDPFGYQWGIATHKEDLTMDELQERGKAWFAEFAASEGGQGE